MLISFSSNLWLMKLIPTGIKLNDKEIYDVTQSMGKAAYFKDEQHKTEHNNLLKSLGEKYGYDWNNCEIQPLTNEVLKRCEDCDEEIPKEDIRIEE